MAYAYAPNCQAVIAVPAGLESQSSLAWALPSGEVGRANLLAYSASTGLVYAQLPSNSPNELGTANFATSATGQVGPALTGAGRRRQPPQHVVILMLALQ